MPSIPNQMSLNVTDDELLEVRKFALLHAIEIKVNGYMPTNIMADAAAYERWLLRDREAQ